MNELEEKTIIKEIENIAYTIISLSKIEAYIKVMKHIAYLAEGQTKKDIEYCITKMTMYGEATEYEDTPFGYFKIKYGADFMTDDAFYIHSEAVALYLNEIFSLFEKLLEMTTDKEKIMAYGIAYEKIYEYLSIPNLKKGNSSFKTNSPFYNAYLYSRNAFIYPLQKEFKFIEDILEKGVS